MPSKKDVEKRRVAAERAAEAQDRAATTRDRKRRWTVGLLAGFLSVMLVVPLAAGLIALLDDGDADVDVDDVVLPAQLAAVEPGRALTGETPCPATDGTEVRTTSFEQAPGLCIDTALDYEVAVATDIGEIVVTVDPGLDTEAANLFVTNARYGLYEDVPFHIVFPEGLTVTGDPGAGDPGFRVGVEVAEAVYEVGTVVMFADTADTIGSQFGFVATPTIVELFTDEQAHPPIGRVTAGQATVDAIIAVAGSPEIRPLPVADVRVQSVSVRELG